ncbi:MAG TPA: aminopeptidase P family protein [Candidatus Desulfaltia sp.]|nr:aminopeptidase P family protein [Candidatus Desulfaltia sp.]
MFEGAVYVQRRKLLKRRMRSGLLLFPGNQESPMNYPANTYPFRQDSSFLYFFGLDTPGVAAVIDVDAGTETIFGDDITLEDVIWMGDLPTIKDRAAAVGVKRTTPLARLDETIAQARKKGRPIHFLPPYRPETLTRLSDLLGVRPQEVRKRVSSELIRAVVAQRSTKTEEEVAEIEKSLAVSGRMYSAAMATIRPGLYESAIVGAIEGIALAHGCLTAFPTIVTMNGHIFHNQYHSNRLEKGRLLVIDSGVSSARGYASDITRTIPVSGAFSRKQREIYEIVLKGQLQAIAAMRPGARFKDIHLATARTMASGLKDIGLMTGDVDEAVSAGAHALFFPHGLGHMIGLDVHDMEGLGEDYVGYDETVTRSKQFGLAYLRVARELRPGFVLTVEPGIYFVPALIERWQAEKRFAQFINYTQVEGYRDFTGIRIEDDVLVTEKGSRVLGKPIPKKAGDLEKARAAAKAKR